MKSLIRGLTILLVLLMLLPSVISCKNNKGNTDVESTESDVAEDSETVIEYDDKGYQKDNLGMQDFGGKEIRILGWKDAPFKEFDLDYKEVEGTPLGQAVYNRNMKVEHRMNVSLKYNLVPGNNSNRSNYIKEVETALADRSVDGFACYSMCATSLMLQGYVLDLKTMDYLDFDAPWWSRGIIESSSLYDRVYFGTGSIAPSLLGETYVMYYNKAMADVYLRQELDALGAETLYDLVDDGRWTVDNFIRLAKTVTISGITKTENDTYGYVTIGAGYDSWYFASNMSTLDNAEDGSLQISDDWGSSKTQELADKLLGFFSGSSAGAAYGDVSVAASFMNGTALFRNDALSRLPNMAQTQPVGETGVGVLPMPMWDEDQNDYVSIPGFGFTLYSIARSSDRKDEIAATIECLASEGYRLTEPNLYEVLLKARSTDGEGSADDRRMMDLVRDSIYIDSGRIHNDGIGGFGWKMFRSSIQEDLTAGNPNSTYASFYATNKDTVKSKLDIINTSILNIEEIYS